MNLYEILGVKANATIEDIKAAYKKRAKECHPDKGGSNDEFAALSEAFEILSNPRRRKFYDEHDVHFTVSEEEAITMRAMNQLENTIIALVEKYGEKIIYVDIMQAMKEGARGSIKECKVNIRKTIKQKRLFKKVKSRLKHVESKETHLHFAIHEKIKFLNKQINRWDAEIKVALKALEIIDKHEFKFEDMEPETGRSTTDTRSFYSGVKFHVGGFNRW
jgi:curved DNA-binding protein CbpA